MNGISKDRFEEVQTTEDLANDRPECGTRFPVAYPNIVGAKALIMMLMRGLNSLVGCCGN